MRGKIEEARRSQSGKTVGLRIGSRWYQTKQFEMENCVGCLIEFADSASDYKGKTMYWANDAVVVEHDAQEPKGPDPRIAAGLGANTPLPPTYPSNPPPTNERDAMVYLPMTSNVVAHAIAAGVITEPKQISAWAQAAFLAAKGVVEPLVIRINTQSDEDFSDDIPF